MKSRRGRFIPKQAKEQALYLDKIRNPISPGEGWSALLPGKAARGCLHSGSQTQGRRNTEEEDDYGCFENLPLPAQPGTIFTKRTYEQANLLFRLKSPRQVLPVPSHVQHQLKVWRVSLPASCCLCPGG